MYFRWRRAAIDSVEAPLLPNCMPGRQYHYSTLGFTYVGAVLEEVLGEDIEKILTDELFQPFQLRSMKLADGPVVSGPSGPVDPFDRAAGYVYDTLLVAPREVSYEDTTWKVLGGGLEVDALDLARFGLLTLNGSIVSFTTRDNTLWRSRTGSAVNYSNGRPAIQVGLGWNLRNVTAGGANRRVAEHGGSGRGARPQLQVYRDDGIVIAIMTNQNEAQAPATNDIGAHPVQSFADVVANVVFSNLPP
jgi:CubicO group peptidase (beta-lactamase class C family)